MTNFYKFSEILEERQIDYFKSMGHERDALYAKYMMGQFTLADVLRVVTHPGLERAVNVRTVVADDAGLRVQLEASPALRFKVVGNELQTYKPKSDVWSEFNGPVQLWFNLNEPVRLRNDQVEVKPLKGTKKKMAWLTFLTGLPKNKVVSVLERLKPS